MEKICEICGKTFTRVSSLKRHAEAVHQNAEMQCEKCFKKFNRKDVMERHQQKCCVCRLCGVNFSNSLELVRHHCAERKRSGLAPRPQKKRTQVSELKFLSVALGSLHVLFSIPNQSNQEEKRNTNPAPRPQKKRRADSR